MELGYVESKAMSMMVAVLDWAQDGIGLCRVEEQLRRTESWTEGLRGIWDLYTPVHMIIRVDRQRATHVLLPWCIIYIAIKI